MPTDGDPNPANVDSSATFGECARAAQLVSTHQREILNQWLSGAIERIPAAQDKGRSEIADHFKEVLDDVVAALEAQRGDNGQELRVASRVSAMHGRERAVVEGYTVGQLTQEYVEMRRVLTAFCRQHDIDDAEALEVINRVVEAAALVSINAFSQSMQDIQQKLVGTLVHDVRTPLGVAYNFAELISVAQMPVERRKEISRTITRSLRRALDMLEGLLDVAKLRAGQGLEMKFECADLSAELRGICQEAQQIYHQQIKCATGDQPVKGIFDVALITRTVENLISNAAKFGFEETPITISLNDCGLYVDVRVHNYGKPIPQEERADIFGFFSETAARDHSHSQAKGWGLGLSLIKAVADNHGGRVVFESGESQGTTFGMQLFKNHRREGDEVKVLV